MDAQAEAWLASHGPYVRPSEVAKLLCLSRSSIYRLYHEGVLPGIKIAESVRISLEGVRDFIRGTANMISTAKAASMLGLDVRQIDALFYRNRILGERRQGRIYLFEESVKRYREKMP